MLIIILTFNTGFVFAEEANEMEANETEIVVSNLEQEEEVFTLTNLASETNIALHTSETILLLGPGQCISMRKDLFLPDVKLRIRSPYSHENSGKLVNKVYTLCSNELQVWDTNSEMNCKPGHYTIQEEPKDTSTTEVELELVRMEQANPNCDF